MSVLIVAQTMVLAATLAAAILVPVLLMDTTRRTDGPGTNRRIVVIAVGASIAVPCGLTASCNDHSLLTVVVHDGQAVTGINPNDWSTTGLPAEPHS